MQQQNSPTDSLIMGGNNVPQLIFPAVCLYVMRFFDSQSNPLLSMWMGCSSVSLQPLHCNHTWMVWLAGALRVGLVGQGEDVKMLFSDVPPRLCTTAELRDPSRLRVLEGQRWKNKGTSCRWGAPAQGESGHIYTEERALLVGPHPRRHFIVFSPQDGLLRGLFIMFSPMKGHLSGYFIMRSPLDGHPTGYLIDPC